MVKSIALYAGPIWAEAMDKKTYRIGVDAAYGRFAPHVISAFCSLYESSLGDWRDDAAS